MCASQVTSSNKLLRLQSELLLSLELAKNVLNREMLKHEGAHQSQNAWENQLSLVELKRKFPSLGTREDKNLLHDKEHLLKRPRTDSASVCVQGMPHTFSMRSRDQSATLRDEGSYHILLLLMYLNNKNYSACKELCILSFQTILCKQFFKVE